MLFAKLAVRKRRYLGRLDFAASSPEDIGIPEVDAGFPQMGVDSRLVREHHVLVQPMRHGHDVDVVKLLAAFAPIRMRDDMVAPDFTARVELLSRWNRPVEQRIVARYPFVTRSLLHVLQECRKP